MRPEAVRRQQDAEAAPAPVATSGQGGEVGTANPSWAPGGTTTKTGATLSPKPIPSPKRFHGTVTLDSTRVGRDAGRIADEIIAHLDGLVGSTVKVTLEIESEMPGGFPENVVRTVTENGRTLKFTSQGFETE